MIEILSSAVRRGLAATLVILAVAGCGEERATGPVANTSLLAFGQTGLIQCPTDQTVISAEIVTPDGGIVTTAGSSINLPAGAVTLPTLITVAVPASKYMMVDVTANNLLSFVFEQPVSITIDYSRCGRSNIDRAPLTVWHIDPVTKRRLEKMESVDDKERRAITFRTGHLSAYAVAF